MAVSINNPRYGNVFFNGENYADLRSISRQRIEDNYSAIILGGDSARDGLGGMYSWSATSSANDDGQNVIAPFDAGSTGRWLKIAIGKVGAAGPVGGVGPAGPGGVPGGNVMSIGNFASASGMTIRTGVNLVQTSGHTGGRRGAARYAFDTAVNTAFVTANPMTSFMAVDENGAARGFRLNEEIITPFQFGAAGTDVTGAEALDQPALEALFLHIQTAGVIADMNGTFRTTNTLFWGRTGATPLCRNYVGSMTLRAVGAMGAMIEANALSGVAWHGQLTLIGTGSTIWANRTVDCGIHFKTTSSFSIFPQMVLTAFRAGGIITRSGGTGTSGSSANFVPMINATFCGTGTAPTTWSMQDTWSNPVSNVGYSNSQLQQTVVSVGTGYPAFLDAYGSLQDTMPHVRISGQYYEVIAFDRVANTITLFPWLDPADIATGSGTMTWVFGEALRLVGGDGNVWSLPILNFTQNGVGLRMGGLYGSAVGQLTLQGNGIGVTLGANRNAICYGFNIDNFYPESNNMDILQKGSCYGTISASAEFRFAKVLSGPAPRSVETQAGQRSNNYTAGSIFFAGKNYSREKGAGGAIDIGTATASMSPTRALTPTFFANLNTYNFTLPALSTVEDSQKNVLFGYDSAAVIISGTGPNLTPTGSFTFTPTSSQTVNGGTAGVAYTFPAAMLSGPTTFLAHYDWTLSAWTIEIPGRALKWSVTYDPPSIAAGGTITTTVAIVGGIIGEPVETHFSGDLLGLIAQGRITSATVATIRLTNPTAAAIDPASGTLTVVLPR